MKRTLVALAGILALSMTPAALAKSDKAGGGGADPAKDPASSATAYEHADEKAKFLRDTHDLGQHKGQGEEIGKDKDKDKDKDKAQGSDENGSKQKAKSKEKKKGKGAAGEDEASEMAPASGKPQEQGGKADADKLMEPAGKGKGKK